PSRCHNRSNIRTGPSFQVRVVGCVCPQTSAKACGEYWLKLPNGEVTSHVAYKGNTLVSSHWVLRRLIT
ncbi:MAG: hypothetical protein ABSD29_24770, partial [Verrucomicrobiota bacterium]